MAERTPGQWYVHELNSRVPFAIEVRSPAGTAYRTVALFRSLTHDRADAHLTAAAPEMFDLLESLHEDLCRYAKLTEGVWSSGSIAFDSMASDICRLLAKARGEASDAGE